LLFMEMVLPAESSITSRKKIREINRFRVLRFWECPSIRSIAKKLLVIGFHNIFPELKTSGIILLAERWITPDCREMAKERLWDKKMDFQTLISTTVLRKFLMILTNIRPLPLYIITMEAFSVQNTSVKEEFTAKHLP